VTLPKHVDNLIFLATFGIFYAETQRSTTTTTSSTTTTASKPATTNP
jgi:hypothetical protein